jgi:hypothetical protein
MWNHYYQAVSPEDAAAQRLPELIERQINEKKESRKIELLAKVLPLFWRPPQNASISGKSCRLSASKAPLSILADAAYGEVTSRADRCPSIFPRIRSCW